MSRASRSALGWRSPFVFLVVLVSALLSSAPLYGQIGGAATVAGTITDESSAALPGVNVTITNIATGRAQTLVTTSEGRYRAGTTRSTTGTTWRSQPRSSCPTRFS